MGGCVRRCAIGVLITAGLIFTAVDARCAPQPVQLREPSLAGSFPAGGGDSVTATVTADKKNRGSENEWQSLTPQERDNLRRKWNRFNRKPDQDRQDIEHLHDNWQQLSPDERRQIERALESWDSLPDQERESIRRRFK